MHKCVGEVFRVSLTRTVFPGGYLRLDIPGGLASNRWEIGLNANASRSMAVEAGRETCVPVATFGELLSQRSLSGISKRGGGLGGYGESAEKGRNTLNLRGSQWQSHRAHDGVDPSAINIGL